MTRPPPSFRYDRRRGRLTWRDPPPSSRRRALAGRALRLALALCVLAGAALFAAREWAGTSPVGAAPYGTGPEAPPTLGGVARVNDGDTVTIGATRIRLEGIDAPEFGQMCVDAANAPFDCGRRAADELTRWIAGRPLACAGRDFDRHRRVLARCAAPDGADAGAAMIGAGWAVAFDPGRDAAYDAAEAQAAAAKAGLWAGRFERPRAWRNARPARPDAPRGATPAARMP